MRNRCDVSFFTNSGTAQTEVFGKKKMGTTQYNLLQGIPVEIPYMSFSLNLKPHAAKNEFTNTTRGKL